MSMSRWSFSRDEEINRMDGYRLRSYLDRAAPTALEYPSPRDTLGCLLFFFFFYSWKDGGCGYSAASQRRIGCPIVQRCTSTTPPVCSLPPYGPALSRLKAMVPRGNIWPDITLCPDKIEWTHIHTHTNQEHWFWHERMRQADARSFFLLYKIIYYSNCHFTSLGLELDQDVTRM